MTKDQPASSAFSRQLARSPRRSPLPLSSYLDSRAAPLRRARPSAPAAPGGRWRSPRRGAARLSSYLDSGVGLRRGDRTLGSRQESGGVVMTRTPTEDSERVPGLPLPLLGLVFLLSRLV